MPCPYLFTDIYTNVEISSSAVHNESSLEVLFSVCGGLR